jgi:hypothetical protein
MTKNSLSHDYEYDEKQSRYFYNKKGGPKAAHLLSILKYYLLLTMNFSTVCWLVFVLMIRSV